jgi:Tfp pilus assembly PilM family ATPase
MVAACPHDLATQWVEAFAVVGLDVMGLDVRPLAAARACADVLSAATGLTAILDLGWSAATIVVLDRDVVVFERRFEDFGLSKLHSSFAAQLRMTEELADALLWSPHGIAEGAASEGLLVEAKDALRMHFEALASEVVASIQYVSKRYPEMVLERALLIGGGAALSDVSDFFAATLGVECPVVTPLSGASCAPALVGECTPALTLAAGLARYTDD